MRQQRGRRKSCQFLILRLLFSTYPCVQPSPLVIPAGPQGLRPRLPIMLGVVLELAREGIYIIHVVRVITRVSVERGQDDHRLLLAVTRRPGRHDSLLSSFKLKPFTFRPLSFSSLSCSLFSTFCLVFSCMFCVFVKKREGIESGCG